MDPVLSLVIHEILPTEILKMIFEEHAVLEWQAPTVDGQVCRFWRDIVLNTPRAWAYLEIPKNYVPSMGEVDLRLHRSSPAPLHIDTREVGPDACQKLYDLFGDHHTRIASLRMQFFSQSFYHRQDFPCMRLLDVANWYPVWWGSIPKLRSLQLRGHLLRKVSLSELAPLETLSLSCFQCTSVLRHSHSLTALMLSNVLVGDAISGPVTFPCLTYLSLSGVWGLKPHVIAPRLATYHEEGLMTGQSFNISIPSLVEYGMYFPTPSSSDPVTWFLSFPNIQRLAIRADEVVLLSFFTSLANQPHSLPALQTISVGGRRECTYQTFQMAEEIQDQIESLVLARNGACNGNIVLCIEKVAPFQIPIFFGRVSDLSLKWFSASLTHISDAGSW